MFSREQSNHCPSMLRELLKDDEQHSTVYPTLMPTSEKLENDPCPRLGLATVVCIHILSPLVSPVIFSSSESPDEWQKGWLQPVLSRLRTTAASPLVKYTVERNSDL